MKLKSIKFISLALVQQNLYNDPVSIPGQNQYNSFTQNVIKSDKLSKNSLIQKNTKKLRSLRTPD